MHEIFLCCSFSSHSLSPRSLKNQRMSFGFQFWVFLRCNLAGSYQKNEQESRNYTCDCESSRYSRRNRSFQYNRNLRTSWHKIQRYQWTMVKWFFFEWNAWRQVVRLGSALTNIEMYNYVQSSNIDRKYYSDLIKMKPAMNMRTR